MKLFITLSKRNLFVLLFCIIIGILIVAQISSVGASGPDGSTNALRVTFLESRGIAAKDSTVSAKNIVIPENFSPVYERYNELQKKSGFDLSRHKGKNAVLYSYPLSDDTEAHIIVCDGIIIGGDIASIKLGGGMKPL